MRGSVVKRGSGYSVVVELDKDPVTGKRRQKLAPAARGPREPPKRALTELLVAAKDSGTYVGASIPTVRAVRRRMAGRDSTHGAAVNALQLRPEPPTTCRAPPRVRAAMPRPAGPLMPCTRRCWRMGTDDRNAPDGGLYPAAFAISTRSSTGHSRMPSVGSSRPEPR